METNDDDDDNMYARAREKHTRDIEREQRTDGDEKPISDYL